MRRPVTVSGVAFAYGGREIVASYSGEQIYTFRTADHARPANAFSAAAADRDPATCARMHALSLPLPS
jgi:hypothetical protein